MSEEGLYLLKLSFNPPKGTVGAGEMTLALTVDAPSGNLHGQTKGIILQGTQHPQPFTAMVSGVMHSTGLGSIVRVGSVSGNASLPFPGQAIGSSNAPFSASFSLDSNWQGQGQFSVGTYNYKSDVKRVD